MKTIIVLLLFPITLFAQNTIGLPEVLNYNKQTYNAGLQNWDFEQDINGIIYIANNEGLLSFDGTFWKLNPLPNKTIVRSVKIDSDGKIYVGGQGEFGFFSPAPNGNLVYNSLIQSIPAKDRNFGDVWDIISFKNNIYFRTDFKLFKLSNQSFNVYQSPDQWYYLGIANDRLFAHDSKAGLLVFDDNNWKPLSQKNELPVDDPVTAILQAGEDSCMITTLKSGLFILNNDRITKLNSLNTTRFISERIYAAVSINNKRVALATNNNGVFITDFSGNIIQSFSMIEGLQNNNVLSIFLDQQSNLWLGLDNGIDFIAYNSAIKKLTPSFQNGSGYTAAIFDNQLYTGTSNGLFGVKLQPENDLSFSKGTFTSIENTKGQAWNLTEINNQLLLGHHEGVFQIKNSTAIPITTKTGFWNFIPTSRIFPTPQLIAGNYNGLMYFNYVNGSFIPSEVIPNFKESSRFVTIDNTGDIWVSHPYQGIYKIYKTVNGNYLVKEYTDKNGLPSKLNNHIYKIKNEVVVATEKGIYIYNDKKEVFEFSAYYKNIFGNQSIRYLKEDPAGNIWFVHDKTLGVVDFTEKEPVILYINEVKEKMLSGFEFIYPVNLQNIFLGGEKGFFHINYEKYKASKPILKVQIRNVIITNNKDSTLFGGYFNTVNETPVQLPDQIPSINHQWKSIRFRYSSPQFGYQSNLEYSYMLEGFEKKWSDWTKRTDKEYTNLSAGKYLFKVKVRNNLGNESELTAYSFKILPPWYQTQWMFIIYILLFISAVYILYKWQKKKFKEQQIKYEEEQKRILYIHNLEKSKSESELMNLQNEKLESEINYKNSELASSAMHLVKKGELLTKIKSELSQVIKAIQNPHAKEEINKLVKSLKDDEKVDDDWENFSKHFDKVHSDFLVAVKEKYPDITPSELKLCAYLRMNLTSKEIAQLMNISVRGVEISRYRLRKKLGISSDVNLFDHLITIGNNKNFE